MLMKKRGRLPDFLVLGTQKGGTTSLQKILSMHRQIYLPTCKEVHYFTLNYNKPITWYEEHYQNSKWWHKKGDITPYYLYHPRAAERIHKLLPNAKLIVLLRNPIERTISQFYHSKRNGFEKLEIYDALKAEKDRLKNGGEYSQQKHSYVSRSMYVEQLEAYEKVFRKNRMLILKSEDLFEKSTEIIRRIEKFLGVRHELKDIVLTRENAGKGEGDKVDEALKKELDIVFTPTTIEMKQKYGITWK